MLHSGGEVHGELVNRNESPRTTYVRSKPPAGGQVTLEAEQVKKVTRQNAAEVKYDQIRGNVSRHGRRPVETGRMVPREPAAQAAHACTWSAWSSSTPIMPAARHGLGYQPGPRPLGHARNADDRKRLSCATRARGCCRKKSRSRSKSARKNWPSWIGRNKLKRWQPLARHRQSRPGDRQHQGNRRSVCRQRAGQASERSEIARAAIHATAVRRGAGPAASAARAWTPWSTPRCTMPTRKFACPAWSRSSTHRYKPAVSKYVQALKNKDNAIVNRAAVVPGPIERPGARSAR